jgi:hypothetical protein
MVLTRGRTEGDVEVVAEKSLVVALVTAATCGLVKRVLGTAKAETSTTRQELNIILTKINIIPVRMGNLVCMNIEGNILYVIIRLGETART